MPKPLPTPRMERTVDAGDADDRRQSRKSPPARLSTSSSCCSSRASARCTAMSPMQGRRKPMPRDRPRGIGAMIRAVFSPVRTHYCCPFAPGPPGTRRTLMSLPVPRHAASQASTLHTSGARAACTASISPWDSQTGAEADGATRGRSLSDARVTAQSVQ